MTIPLLPLPFHPESAGFDDHWQRRHYHMQQALRQMAPLTADGGRMVLWRCSQCQHPWCERSAQSVAMHLSPEQSRAYAASLKFRGTLEHLPQALCPSCSLHLLGGILRMEEQVGGEGYCFTWRTGDPEEVWVYQIMQPDEQAITDLLEQEAFDPLLETILTQPTDLLVPTPALRPLLAQLAQFPQPGGNDLIPFATHHLHQVAKRLPMATTGFVCGCFWFPTIHLPHREDLPLVAVSLLSPTLCPTAPVDLLEGWTLLFHHVLQYVP